MSHSGGQLESFKKGKRCQQSVTFFYRDSASEALTAMSENVSVFRAVNAVSEGGLHHKSAVVRGEVARILDLVVAQMGAERVSEDPHGFAGSRVLLYWYPG